MSKPRVLYLCGRSPWPRNGGALLRNYWMIDALSKKYSVDLVTADQPQESMPESFARLVDTYRCFPRSEGSSRALTRVLDAAHPGSSTVTAGWTNAAMFDYVSELVGRSPFAAIQVDLPLAAVLPRRDAIPIVYNAHNCEAQLLRRRSSTEPLHRALLLRADAMRVRRIERELVHRAALITVCSEQDLSDFERFCPNVRSKAVIVPNGVDMKQYEALRTVRPQPHAILITGSMDWRPNLLGLRWFLREVLPIVRRLTPQATVTVAGRMTPDVVREVQRSLHVRAVANPESMDPHLSAACVVVAPVLTSSGTRLRILEAWAAGRPVVTTSAGAFGLKYTQGIEMLVGDSPQLFAQNIERVINEPRLSEYLAAHAAVAAATYDWSTIGSTLRTAYEPLTAPLPGRVETIRDEIVLAGRV